MTTKYLTVPFEIKQVEEEDEFFRVKGLGSTFGNVDRGGDIVIRGAFKQSLTMLKQQARAIPGKQMYNKIIPMLYQHDPNQPIGSFIVVDESERGLEMEAILPKADTFVSGRIIPQMKVGSLADLSIGYITREREFDEEGNRKLIQVDLVETSLVTIPMNEMANVTGMKAFKFKNLPLANRNHEYNSTESSARIAELKGDEYESLGIEDVIDGKLHVVPQALFAKAAELWNSKSTDSATISHLECYYDKLDLESPFEGKNAFRIDDIDTLSEKDLEQLLNHGAAMSRKSAKRIVAALRVERDANKGTERDAGFTDLVADLKSFNQSIKQG